METVTAWEQSGRSGVAFAAERGINRQLLYQWRQRMRRERATGGGGAIFEVAPVALAAWGAEVPTARGPVRISLSAAPAWAGALLRELGRC